MDIDRHRDHNHGIRGDEKGFFKVYDMASFLFWSARRLLRQAGKLSNLKIIADVLKAIPGISFAFLIFDTCFDLISHSLLSERSLHTRVFKIAMVLLTTPVAIMAFIFSAALMNTIGACLNLVNNAWDAGTVVFSRLFGELRDNDNPEDNRAANLKLAEASHNMAISAFFILGGALLLNPVTAIAGTAILIAITAYAIADRLKINPLRWLGNQLFDHPFKKAGEKETPSKESTRYVNDKIFDSSSNFKRVTDVVSDSIKQATKIQYQNDSIFNNKSSVKQLIEKFENPKDEHEKKLKPV